MKKMFIIILILALSCLVSCGIREDDIEVVKDTSVQEESSQETDLNIETTSSEWVNPYKQNHRVVSKQTILPEYGDYEILSLVNELHDVRNTNSQVEYCIAEIILTNIEDDISTEDSNNRTMISFEITKIFEHNGVGRSFKENMEIKRLGDTVWILCDDGTYEIRIWSTYIPMVEVGSKYIVNLTYNLKGEVDFYCLTLPYNDTGCYTETLAVGAENHWPVSDETMWYYDINSSYYYERWNAIPDEIQRYKDEYGVDVFDKSFIQWKIEQEWGT